MPAPCNWEELTEVELINLEGGETDEGSEAEPEREDADEREEEGEG